MQEFLILGVRSDFFIPGLSFFAYSALTLDFQFFNTKLCLQISGLRTRNLCKIYFLRSSP